MKCLDVLSYWSVYVNNVNVIEVWRMWLIWTFRIKVLDIQTCNSQRVILLSVSASYRHLNMDTSTQKCINITVPAISHECLLFW